MTEKVRPAAEVLGSAAGGGGGQSAPPSETSAKRRSRGKTPRRWLLALLVAIAAGGAAAKIGAGPVTAFIVGVVALIVVRWALWRPSFAIGGLLVGAVALLATAHLPAVTPLVAEVSNTARTAICNGWQDVGDWDPGFCQPVSVVTAPAPARVAPARPATPALPTQFNLGRFAQAEAAGSPAVCGDRVVTRTGNALVLLVTPCPTGGWTVEHFAHATSPRAEARRAAIVAKTVADLRSRLGGGSATFPPDSFRVEGGAVLWDGTWNH